LVPRWKGCCFLPIFFTATSIYVRLNIYVPVLRFSGPVAALRAGTRAKSKIDCPLTTESSHGSVTPAPNKLLLTGDISHSLVGVELSSTITYRTLQLPIRQAHKLLTCTLVNKLLAITRRNFSKANMNLNHLPLELLGLIVENIFPDEWHHYNSGLEVLNLRIVCRKYSKCVF
jgi:hypothetical protein